MRYDFSIQQRRTSSSRASKLRLRRSRVGMTIIELAVGLLVSMLVATAVLGLLNNQITFARFIQRQNFMLVEAPQVNNILSRMLFSADTARLYSTIAAAKAGGTGVTEDANALVLAFRQPDNSFKYGLVGFDTEERRLEYFLRTNSGWERDPAWTITAAAEGVTFWVENGVIRCLITGPNQEQLTFAGAGQD